MPVQPHENEVMERLAKFIEFNESELHPFQIVHKIQVQTKVSYKRAVSAYRMLRERLSYLIPSECIEEENKLLKTPYSLLFENLDLEITQVEYDSYFWKENVRFWNKVLSTPNWDGKHI